MHTKRSQPISPLELLVQTIILCAAMVSMGLVTRWWYVQAAPPGDFLMYYNAGLGIFKPPWSYKEFTGVIFTPLTLTEPLRACMIWAGVQTAAFMVLTHKMFEVKYGWVLVVLVLPQFVSLVRCGNIQILLTVAAIHPVTALLAGLVKPHHLVFAGLVAFALRRRLRTDGGTRTLKT